MSLTAEAGAEETEAKPSAVPVRRRGNYPVALHLALFAIGMLTPVLLIVTWMLIDNARLRRADSLHDATTMVGHLNATIDLEIQKAIAVGETLATSRELVGGDRAAFDRQARDVAKRLGVVIVSRDLSGQQTSSTAAPIGAPLPVSNSAVLAIDHLAAERRKPVVSDLVIGTLMQVPLAFVDIPVFQGNDVVAFIDVVIRPQRIGEILAQDLPDGWIAGVVGRDGRLIGRSVDQDRNLGKTNTAFLDQVTQSEGVFESTSREGEAIAGVYVRSALSGWVVSVGVPETVLHAPARTAMSWLFGLVDAALAISFLLGWWLSRRISSPIRELVFRARELGDGRRPATAQSGVAEVNEVAEALIAASVELDRRGEATRQAASTVRANQERLQLVQETAGIGTIDWDMVADRSVCSPRYLAMMSLPRDQPARLTDFLERLHPADRVRVEKAHQELRRLGGPFEDEFRVMTQDGEERWIYVKGSFDLKDGTPVRMVAAALDITERKRSEEHLRFLLREISHRSKNLLAVILAMASQTAKATETVGEFRRRFGERLMGLSASHDLLVNQNWMGASVGNLVRGQLSPFVDAQDPRVRIGGPDVDVKAEVAEALGIALHELATNSLKFGALKDQDGTVDITWEVYEAGGEEGGRRFRMDWVEHTAFPVAPPTHKGFGRMIIEHSVEATLGGTVTLEFPVEGLRWRIDAPATCLAPSVRGMAA